MTKQLLSKLFPNFVKKEYLQAQRLSQGPFGEGLEKGRTYLKPGQQAPEGANVQTGSKGGKYYDDMGGGGVAEGPSESDKQTQGFQDARAEIDAARGAKEQGPEAYEAYEADRKQRGSEGYQDRKQAFQEQQEASGYQDAPLGGAFGDVTPRQVAEGQAETDSQQADQRAKESSIADTLDPDRQAGMDAQRAKIDEASASPPDVSEATFDGQGNIQTPGNDPYPVSEMISDGTDSESLSHLIDAYQNESGGKQSVPGILSENYSTTNGGQSGPLNGDSFDEYTSDLAQYDDAFISDDDYNDAMGFFDWLGSKAGTDTQKMLKMIQKHNNNPRPNPVILSNKGGRQRK